MAIVYRLAYMYYKPQFVIILGDLFSYQNTINEEFEWRTNRYKTLFPKYTDHFYNLSGNHDIGYGFDMTINNVHRFENTFGKVNFMTSSEDYELIFINSQAVDGSLNSNFYKDTWEFIQSIPKHTNKKRFLFMHIPLYPNRVVTCEENLYEVANGIYKFQNYLTHNTSELLVDILNPDFIVSGHNHDGCLHQIHTPFYTTELPQRSFKGEIGQNKLMMTVRSIMGMYDSSYAILQLNTTHYEYNECPAFNFITIRIFLILDVILFGVFVLSLLYWHCK